MTTSNHTPFAILSAAAGSDPVAVLALDLAADDSGWQQLLPAGYFRAIDGRPNDVPGGQWFLDASAAGQLINALNDAANELVIDYEHQTLNTEQNGQPAPAAGWFKEAEWREGSGLWIRPRWTDRARDFIRNGEYRYLSAVFPYDKTTGQPLRLHSAGLVNRPGLDGLQAVTALNAHLSDPPTATPPKETVMNEKLRELLAKLGVEVPPPGENGEQGELSDEQAQAALSALNTLQGERETATTELAALKAKPHTTDLSQYVPAATYNALVTEMAALKAGTEQADAKQLINDARQAGKVLASELDYLNQFAEQQGVAALKGLLDARPAVAALKGQQAEQSKPPQQKNPDGLTDEELAVCKAMGLSPEEYRKANPAQ